MSWLLYLVLLWILGFMPFWTKVFLFYPRVGLLDHLAALFLIFKETSLLFSIVAVLIYIPTSSEWGFPVLHTLSSIYYLHLLFADFWWWPFWPVWGDSSLQVWFAFPGSSFKDCVPIFLELGTHCRDSYTWSYLLPSEMFLRLWREFTSPWWCCLIPGGP